jgi:hypothetical protein
MNKHIVYAKTVLKHKWFVLVECFKEGLYWQGIIHDWSKFIPWVWIAYANVFGVKGKSPRDKTGAYDPAKVSAEFDKAWCIHQKEKHHWQSWILLGDNGSVKVLRMPRKYVIEMICDWRGAGRAYSGESNPLKWYQTNRSKMNLHPDTMNFVDTYLHGEQYWEYDCICGAGNDAPFHPMECRVDKEYRY